MAERYSRIFLNNEKLFAQGAPVSIEVVSLLKDNVSGQTIGQLKLRNLSSKKIISCSISVEGSREDGSPLKTGETGYVGGYYFNPAGSPGGEFMVIFWDEDGNEIGRGTVNLN